MKDEIGQEKVTLKRTSDDAEGESSQVKKCKVMQSRSSFSGASSFKVLNEDLNQKVAFLQMKLPSEENAGESHDAVVIIEKKSFNMADVSGIFSDQTKLAVEMKNDAYGTYTVKLPEKYCEAKATVICPATEKHIAKYSWEPFSIIKETQNDYEKITKPMIEEKLENKVFNLQWIYNILEGKAEGNKIIYEDPDPNSGFVIVMDYKWTGEDAKLLHCLGLPKRRDLKSIRDLNQDHVKLLENMKAKALQVFEERFKVKPGSVRAYFHYQPSFYHLHIHFSNVDSGSTAGIDAWRAHLLDDVIDNLKLSSDYYKKKTLAFTLRENDALSVEFKNRSSNIE